MYIYMCEFIRQHWDCHKQCSVVFIEDLIHEKDYFHSGNHDLALIAKDLKHGYENC